MVFRFGMDPKLGQVAYKAEAAPFLGKPAGADWRPRHYGEELVGAIDTPVRGLLDTSLQKAVSILVTNRTLLDQAAAELLAKETMSREDLQSLSTKLARRNSEQGAAARGGTRQRMICVITRNRLTST